MKYTNSQMNDLISVCILLAYNIPHLFLNKDIVRNLLRVHNVVPLLMFIFSHLICSKCHVVSTTVIVTSAVTPCYLHQDIKMSSIDLADWVSGTDSAGLSPQYLAIVIAYKCHNVKRQCDELWKNFVSAHTRKLTRRHS
jgi:hypothetical protein